MPLRHQFTVRRTAAALVLFFALVLAGTFAHADNATCHVVPAHEPSAAEKAYLDGNASQAETLYREALTKTPHDAVQTAALVRALLREQKLDDASSTATSELASSPNSVPLLTVRAEVEYRQGKIAEAAATADQALRLDPCNPRLYLVRARILRLNSMYASERRAINFAHSLDPPIWTFAGSGSERFLSRSASTSRNNFSRRLMAWMQRNGPARNTPLRIWSTMPVIQIQTATSARP